MRKLQWSGADGPGKGRNSNRVSFADDFDEEEEEEEMNYSGMRLIEGSHEAGEGPFNSRKSQ